MILITTVNTATPMTDANAGGNPGPRENTDTDCNVHYNIFCPKYPVFFQSFIKFFDFIHNRP